MPHRQRGWCASTCPRCHQPPYEDQTARRSSVGGRVVPHWQVLPHEQAGWQERR